MQPSLGAFAFVMEAVNASAAVTKRVHFSRMDGKVEDDNKAFRRRT
jgi:hypothetical protein